MPKYKKCPRCDINYILDSEDLCEICKEELRGISHEEELIDLDDETVCPKCGVHFLCEGETICEDCAQKMARDKDAEGIEGEVEWNVVAEEEPETVIPELAAEEADIDPLSLENLVEDEVSTDWAEEKFDDEVLDDIDLELNEEELAELGADEEEAALTEEEEKELEEDLLPLLEDEEEDEKKEDEEEEEDTK